MIRLPFFRKKRVGLALGSGGARGFAHIGAIHALVENDIPIDFIAGSSAGAIVGGAYAMNGSLDSFEKFLNELPYIELIKSFTDIGLGDGIVKGDRLMMLLKQLVGDTKIEACKIPFCAVAAQRDSGEQVLLSRGPLAVAMRASSSVPILFAPYQHEKFGPLIDGGVMQQVPADVVRAMGAEVVIAVNLAEKDIPFNKSNRLEVIQNYGNLVIKGLARANCRDADVVVSPDFISRDWIANFQKKDDVIEAGYKAMKSVITQIRQLM